MATFKVLGEHLSEHILVVSYENGPGGEYVLVTLDCAIVRIKRDDKGVVVDLHEPAGDELVSSLCETADDLWGYHKGAICPRCGEIGDETTIADHGRCLDCHKAWQHGEDPDDDEGDDGWLAAPRPLT